ncbi:MAG: hypothetical protein ACFN0J_02915, partial [Segatella salivae]
MKNCFINRNLVDVINDFSPAVPIVETIDKEATELFEKLNPVLTNGHRDNIITRLLDKNVPREVADVITQLVVNVPHDSGNKGYTDEQIQATIVSRHYQNEIELQQVRDYLDAVAAELFPDEPADPAPVAPAP